MQLGYWLLTYALGVLCFRHRSRTLALAVAAGLLMTLSLAAGLACATGGQWGVRDEYVDMFKAHYLWIGGALIIAIWVWSTAVSAVSCQSGGRARRVLSWWPVWALACWW
jgi:hypothetical protein